MRVHNRFFTVQITNYLRNRKHLPSYRNTSGSSREREMFWGNTSRTRVFPQPFRVLLSFHECFYLTIRLLALDFYLNNRVFLSRNYRLIVAPRKFDVLKTNICPRSEASRANMLVLRAANFQGATIRTIVPRHKHSIVFIVHH